MANSLEEKVIVTAAVTGGIHTPTMSPYLPLTPKDIIEEAVRSYEAGAAVIHVHARTPETGKPAPSKEIFQEIVTGIKSRCNAVICITTGGALGLTTAERVFVVPAFKPELASFNCGSMNFALFQAVERYKDWKFDWEKPYLAGTEDVIYPNTFKTLREFSEVFTENNTKPELEVYDLGMINNVAYLVEKGYVKKPVYIQFVLGILGGAQANTETVVYLYETARKAFGEFNWSVCAAGRNQFNICAASLLLGGNVRVGLEDNLYLGKGVMAKSSGEQVAKIVRIARELGREPATPDEARKILGLKGLAKVNF